MKNKKGFTLVEMIATIAILGVLSFIVVVAISNQNRKAKDQYYKAQKDLIILGGKDYYGDHRSELPKEDGTYEEVAIQELVTQKYIDPVQEYENMECFGKDSTVQVMKIGQGEYMYRVKLTCADYPLEQGQKPKITIAPFNEDGIKTNRAVDSLITIADDDDDLVIARYTITESDKEYKSNAPNKTGSYEEKLNADGKYSINVLAIDRNWNTVTATANYRIYSQKPTIVTAEVRSDQSNYNGLNPSVNVKAKIDETAGDVRIDKIEVILKQGSNSKETKSKTNLDATVASTSFFGWSLGNTLNGTTYTYSIKVTDNYGNTATKNLTYRLYSECSMLTFVSNGAWGECSAKCGGGTRSRTVYYSDQYTGKSCSKVGTESCNDFDCCSKYADKVDKTEGTWSNCSKTCGGGTQTRTITTKYYSFYTGELCTTNKATETKDCNTQACVSVTCDPSRLCRAKKTSELCTNSDECWSWTLSECGQRYSYAYPLYYEDCRKFTGQYTCPNRPLYDVCSWL